MAYRPTSLDFINRPNPVEPHTDPHKHPLHTDQNHLRLLHDSNNVVPTIGVGVGEPPRKRRKSRDGPAHDINRPTLPAVRQQSEKRLRIPPTLSGLHQPPPDAGILPSISVNGLRSVELPERGAPAGQQQVDVVKVPAPEKEPQTKVAEVVDSAAQQESPPRTAEDSLTSKPKSRKNKKWTDAETKCLLKGVEKHGIGSWTKILKDQDLCFDERRSALDLKDRFRVCCPDLVAKRKEKAPTSSAFTTTASTPATMQKPKRSRTTHAKSTAELRDLGIVKGFAQSDRRKRTAYSDAEDQAILDGFRKHGQKWAVMQQDEDLELEARTPMDLRDRMRTRWPEEYARAGLKVKEEKERENGAGGAKQVQRKGEKRGMKGKSTSTAAKTCSKASLELRTDKFSSSSRPPGTQALTAAPAPTMPPPPPPPAKRVAAPAPFLSVSDDVFWGLPLEAAGDDERITLDRRILDWPMTFDNGSTRQNVSASNNIDPIATLNLPRPHPNVASTSSSAFVPSSASTAATLPSLATVTAGSLGPFDFGMGIEGQEQLELPSLLEGFGALEEADYGAGMGSGGDGRTGGFGMPSLEEILG